MSKNGLNYFPLCCQPDDKLNLIEAEYGIRGTAVIYKLFQKIYGEKGYYCEWDDEVGLLFSSKTCGLAGGDKLVSEVISAALKRDLFSTEKYEKYGILTSKGIQERYFLAVKRRKGVEAISEYLLLKVAQIPENVNIISKNVDINAKNDSRNEQIKENKIKEKESKKFPPDCFAVLAAKKLRDGITDILPHQRVPSDDKLDSWAKHIDCMIRLDGRSEKEILALIDFALTDDFWCTNIRSTSKLREKQDTLYAQMVKKQGKIGKVQKPANKNVYNDIDRRRAELGL